MESLFTEDGKQKFISRINHLTPDAKANWGKMNVAQMLRHCQLSINDTVGLSDKSKDERPFMKRFFKKTMSLLLGKVVKKQVLQSTEMKKNMPTADSYKVTGEQDFETEKKNLIEAINVLYVKGVEKSLSAKHPFFGKMSLEEWNLLHVKHLNHHLSQFGV